MVFILYFSGHTYSGPLVCELVWFLLCTFLVAPTVALLIFSSSV